MNKNTNLNNFPRTWSRKICREKYERKDKRYRGQSEKFNVCMIGVSEGEKEIREQTIRKQSLEYWIRKDSGNDRISEWRRDIAISWDY